MTTLFLCRFSPPLMMWPELGIGGEIDIGKAGRCFARQANPKKTRGRVDLNMCPSPAHTVL